MSHILIIIAFRCRQNIKFPPKNPFAVSYKLFSEVSNIFLLSVRDLIARRQELFVVTVVHTHSHTHHTHSHTHTTHTHTTHTAHITLTHHTHPHTPHTHTHHTHITHHTHTHTPHTHTHTSHTTHTHTHTTHITHHTHTTGQNMLPNTDLVHANGHDRIILVIFSQALYKAS